MQNQISTVLGADRDVEWWEWVSVNKKEEEKEESNESEMVKKCHFHES